jgi:hypothetical protein
MAAAVDTTCFFIRYVSCHIAEHEHVSRASLQVNVSLEKKANETNKDGPITSSGSVEGKQL